MNITDKPDWSRLADLRLDCTDAWQEATDPQNEFGETCEACFDVETQEASNPNPYLELTVAVPMLTGLVINDGHGRRYDDRNHAIGVLGYDAIVRLEAAAMEPANREFNE